MRSIRLRNFRSILDTGWLELRPITVLVGANSSGKSGFLRFFPLLRQTVETPTQSPLLWYTDKGYVDFGSFSQALRRGAEPREIGVEFELEVQPDLADESPLRCNVSTTLAEEQGSTYVSRCSVKSADISCSLASDVAGNVTVLEIDGVDELRTHPNLGVVRSNSSLVPVVRFGGKPVPRNLVAARYALDTAFQAVDDVARGIRYIGPSRITPQRYYRVQEVSVQQIAPQGENLAMFLRALRPHDLEGFSRFLRAHLGISLRLHSEGSHVSIVLDDGSGEAFNLIDMGHGFSQVLPVVAQAWASAGRSLTSERDYPTKILAIEQPELHLHPQHQRRLSDMLVGVVHASRALSAEGEPVRLLVETHSEALISRLGELIEEGAFAAEDVMVLLFEKDPRTGITSVRQSPFNERGMLTNWPIGFFAP
jgi:hypothetical protein